VRGLALEEKKKLVREEKNWAPPVSSSADSVGCLRRSKNARQKTEGGGGQFTPLVQLQAQESSSRYQADLLDLYKRGGGSVCFFLVAGVEVKGRGGNSNGKGAGFNADGNGAEKRTN